MNVVYILPINIPTSHNITTSYVKPEEEEIISSEHQQLEEDIAENQIFTLEDLQSTDSSDHSQFIEEITENQTIMLEDSQSNISIDHPLDHSEEIMQNTNTIPLSNTLKSDQLLEEIPQSQISTLEDSISNIDPLRLDEGTMQIGMIKLEIPRLNTASGHQPHLNKEILQRLNIKLEDPWSNTIPDKVTAKETNTNLQQFIIDNSANKNNNPNSKTMKTNEKDKSSCKQEQQRKVAICNICHKSFVNHSKLNWHMHMHDKDRKRFECPKESCGRLYASKQACDLHYKQTHLDEGIFCPICHKIFSVKQTLEVHMRYHTKDFPYQCNNCDRKFAQKGHLTQHIEVKHQNLRYICTEPDCGKIFQNSVSLKNHRYTHSAMPFKCGHCAKEYPQKNKLRVHLLQKHNLDYSLDDLESMRQFQSTRTRHTYVKVQTTEVEEPVDCYSDNSLPLTSDFVEELDVCI